MPVRGRRILILGGTGEAVELALLLVSRGYDVTTSLAGVTQSPVLPKGAVRRGGFGGVEGLRAYIAEHNIALVADATHPFAAQMSRHAANCGAPLMRLERPPWPHEEHWIDVADVAEAVRVLPPQARAFVTIGRKEAAAFFARPDISGVARMIEAPDVPPPDHWRIIRARPPFSIAGETALLVQNRITHLVTKNAGGAQTSAKLTAAREQKIPVVMIARPVKPKVRSFASAHELAGAIVEFVSP